jgi:hypothetical protein
MVYFAMLMKSCGFIPIAKLQQKASGVIEFVNRSGWLAMVWPLLLWLMYMH